MVSVGPPKPLTIWLSIRLSNPKPRAMANKMARIGTMARASFLRGDGKQRTVSQRRGFVYYPVFGEAVDAKINRLDDIVYGKGRSRDFIFRNTPDVVGEEFPKGSNTLVHAIISIIHCQ